MIVQERQTPGKSKTAQALGVHPGGVPAEAEEHENHERTAQPDVPWVRDAASRRCHFDRAPGLGVVYKVPVEFQVLDGGLLADDVDLQRQ